MPAASLQRLGNGSALVFGKPELRRPHNPVHLFRRTHPNNRPCHLRTPQSPRDRDLTSRPPVTIPDLTQLFHQIHHSPARIEAVTSFYKHPLEILSDSGLSAVILYALLGISMEGALRFNFFAATGEFFYHANFRPPFWLKYFIQTPELHSIHHELGVHQYNFADLPIWDRIFGTYKDAEGFAGHCGFPHDNERMIGRMLVFQDVYGR